MPMEYPVPDPLDVEQINNRIQVEPGDDLQSKIDEAGSDGVLQWENGVYEITETLKPHYNQYWLIGPGARLVPQSDINVIDFTGVDEGYFGYLNIRDPGENLTSKYAVLVDDARRNAFEKIHMDNVYNGMRTSSVSGDVAENVFHDIHIDNVRNRGVEIRGETHDNQFLRLFMTGADGSIDGVWWHTSGVDGGNQFSNITILGMDNDGIFIDAGEVEIWMDQVICDECGGTGFFVDSSIHRLFIDRLWASTNGNNGLNIHSASGEAVRDVHINKLYAHSNTNFGLLCDGGGTVERAAISKMSVHGNDVGARFATTTIGNIYIGYLHSRANTTNGVDGNGTQRNVNIMHADVDDGLTTADLGYVADQGGSYSEIYQGGNRFRWHAPTEFYDLVDFRGNGVYGLSALQNSLRVAVAGYGVAISNAENLSGKTGNYDGEIRMDDGTNTAARMTPCVWDNVNAVWRPVNSPSTGAFT